MHHRAIQPFRSLFALLALFVLAAPAVLAEEQSEQDLLVEQGKLVFQSFMADKEMTWFRDHVNQAKGVFIVPQMLKGGFVVGASGGSGVLLTRDEQSGSWSYPAFYSMGAVSFGLQAGAEASEIILMIMTDKGLDSLLSTSMKLGADVTLAAGPVGAGAKAQTADVLSYGRAKGLYGGISIEGAVVKPRDSWNAAYYGKPMRPIEILVKREARNPQADDLRNALHRKLN